MSSTDTKLTKLSLRPGINKNTTALDAEGYYTDCDKVRFFYNKPQKIGGWQKENYRGSIVGVPREITTWVDMDENKYLAIGTNSRLHLLNGGTMNDITPVVQNLTLTNAFSTVSGSPVVKVNGTVTQAAVGDSFYFSSNPASVGGINIAANTLYTITNIQPSYFEFQPGGNATTTVNNSGNGEVNFLLAAGLADNGGFYGWGSGAWGAETWGTPRTSAGINIKLRLWSLDNYGQDLLANPNGGSIYRWDANTTPTTRATLMSANAPVQVNLMLVAREGRHVVAFGTNSFSGNDFDPLLVRWSDSEDYNNWDEADENGLAGEYRLESGSAILGAVQTRREIVIWTDETLYSMTRIGGDFVFGFKDMGKHNGLISQNAMVDVNGIPFWMGFSTFQYYDGTIQTLDCSVQEYLFDPESPGSINMEQKEKVYASTNRQFNEITWFYPSRDSKECDRYVTFNFMDKTWYIGSMDRTIFHDVDIFERPYAASPDGKLFIHEQGKDADASPMYAFLETSYFDLEDGQELMFVDRLVPDNELIKDLQYTFFTKKYPQASEFVKKGPYTVQQDTPKISIRVRGRQAKIKYESNTLGGFFRIGGDRFSVKPDGMR